MKVLPGASSNLGYLSLAPVSLPVGSPQEVPAGVGQTLAERRRSDLLWAELRKERAGGQETGEFHRLRRILEPDPLEEYAVVEDARY